jgi:hypothetical protein
LSDLFAGRQAVRQHAEGEQDRLDDDAIAKAEGAKNF